MPIFCQKHVNSLKLTVLSCHFLIFHDKPPDVMPIFDAKIRQFSQNYTILWAKKNQFNALFFPFLMKKSLLSCPCFVKKRPLFKKQTALMPMYCQKKVNYLKNIMLYSFFSFDISQKKIYIYFFFLDYGSTYQCFSPLTNK